MTDDNLAALLGLVAFGIALALAAAVAGVVVWGAVELLAWIERRRFGLDAALARRVPAHRKGGDARE